MCDSEVPITIAMPSDILFTEQDDRMSPGPVFAFVKALKAVNDILRKEYPDSKELFRVLLISDKKSDSLKTAIREHEMEELITPEPVSPSQYLIDKLKRERTHLYLASEQSKAEEAANASIAAATVFIPENMEQVSEEELRVVFDGDAGLFSNQSERVFQTEELQGFLEHERENVEIPMNEGPFKGFLEALEKLKKKWDLNTKCPIRSYLVTARSAGCGGYRALNTLLSWHLEMDEAVFLGGPGKGPTLEKIKPHIFFDDQMRHVKAALKVGTLACLVPESRAQHN
ncbi:cytosolic 5'-nucleotidase 1A-like [Melanotaenia boesemani]|uniref:cytosolic 5'-nucleotidase 1A-like n=1 Tax=Melanotaenia boesemani TaxID=1250792 RepID=UPI001C044237|nr:cytosolic 5'-nucleotidase 1A-like [Melanotaenia boesemani]